MALKRIPLGMTPFDGQGLSQLTLKAGLGHGRWHGEGPAAPYTQVVRIKTTEALRLLGDPALAAIEGDEERPAEDDVGDGVEAARREVLCAAD